MYDEDSVEYRRYVARWQHLKLRGRRSRPLLQPSPPPVQTPPIPRRTGAIPPLLVVARYAAGMKRKFAR